VLRRVAANPLIAGADLGTFFPMALHLHRAERTDRLADGLGSLLASPLPDPFAQELVLVPARGVERWLSQRLSHVLGRGDATDGVCAGVSFRSPGSLIAEITGTTDDDPWSPDAMVWPLLEAIDASLDETWCVTLATHLGRFEDDPDGEEAELRRGRRYAVARRIAGLFASYAEQRPQLLLDWSEGRATDGIGRKLDDDLGWQPELWRAVVQRIPADPPLRRHEQTLARLAGAPMDLPPRFSLFGHTRLPITEIQLLDALATHHDLHLWLPHPSDTLWRTLIGSHGAVPRRGAPGHRQAGHPLLATLGRDLRELERALPVNRCVDEYLGADTGPDTLLGWLQADIRADAVRAGSRVLARDDRSVQVHSCHSPARQVDVLREVLLGLLAGDASLEPRDILVMCPDIETYAPLIVAGFGLGEVVPGAHPAHRLRVRLADRSLTQTNPLLGVAAQLLALAGGRATATEVLNFAQAAAVRARFGFTDDDLDAMTAWVRESGIRWGFDKEHRKPYGLDQFVQNTWSFGTDRILSGVALSDDSLAWLGTTLPLDDVSSNRVELAGRFAEYVRRLTMVIDSLSGTRALVDWLTALRDGVGLLTATDQSDAWQSAQVAHEFANVLADAGTRGNTSLRLADIRSLLRRRLAGRPTRANFRTGTLTVCTMVPMRSVPHRVVCLVGLDDGVFPRLDLVDGDDVLAREPMTGERDVRSEDRQLLLDALGAATETLVVTYTGADEHTGHRRPPAVPLVELLDTLDQTTSQPVRQRVLVVHPLQPFDIRNVTPGQLGVPTAFTFNPSALVAARAAAGEQSPAPSFFTHPLPADLGDVALVDLLAFFSDPVKGFFRALDFTLPWDVDGVDDAMPVQLDALQEWVVGDRILGDMMRGIAPDAACQAEWRRGTLPPGQLGWRKAKEIRDQAAQLAIVAHRYRQADGQSHDVDIDLGPDPALGGLWRPGRRLTGTVTPVYGERLVSVTYSRLDGKHLLASWIRLLALDAHDPGRGWTSSCIGRAKQGKRTAMRLFGPPVDGAAPVLRELVRLYDAGRREPLPLPLKASFAWAAARFDGDDAEAAREAAARRWTSSRSYPGEADLAAHKKVWGPGAPLQSLLGRPLPDEEVVGEETRLGALAARLWLPLLRAEKEVH
jgi:exodeoxyribonuclease V gamma subunit